MSFSNDGAALVTGEEDAFHDNGSTSACPGGTSAPVGALWFYDLTDPGRPLLRGYHQLPREFEPVLRHDTGCSAHNFNVVPVRGDRDIVVTAWYTGGFSAVDFTDLSAPKEIAQYQPDPLDEDRRPFYWSAYWYRDHVFATSGWRTNRQKLDVFRIDDVLIGDTYRLPYLNAQSQEALRDAPHPAPAAPPADAQPPAAGTDRCRRPSREVRLRRARRIVRADLLQGGRRIRRLRTRGHRVIVNLRALAPGRYLVRIRYRDRRGRVRSASRRIVAC